ncbi:hypothetical protein L2E82_46012 [Cichorium intybus]|uniref:Uncharacterized protein n=1 Tax=Cichorium intybus TaxID=13427 RepID=A0ACB8ZVZ0_CICIN|nr:hypothetical protein L2E82_46012 [Cichorium intybus]
MPAKVWQPSIDALEEGEELQCDPSAYNSLHAFHIGWPCLSFDTVRYSLALVRTEFPHTIYCVSSTLFYTFVVSVLVQAKMVQSLKNHKKAKQKNKGSKKEDGSSSSNSIPSMPAKVWQPGVDALEEGEELQCDPCAYNSLHAFHIGWPCLGFDIVRDSLGLVRTEFPHTIYCVTGTQAMLIANNAPNSTGIFKISKISGKQRELLPTKTSNGDTDVESDSSDSDEDEMENEGPKAPVFQVAWIRD